MAEKWTRSRLGKWDEGMKLAQSWIAIDDWPLAIEVTMGTPEECDRVADLIASAPDMADRVERAQLYISELRARSYTDSGGLARVTAHIEAILRGEEPTDGD